MSLFEKHPVHVRKKIALGATIFVALVLIVVMVISYKNQGAAGDGESTSKLTNFYNTILDSGQSIFNRK